MQDLLVKFCATYNLLPNVYRSLYHAVAFGVTKDQMWVEMLMFMRVQNWRPLKHSSDSLKWVKGETHTISMSFYNKSIDIHHTVTLGSKFTFPRSEQIFNYFQLIEMQQYIIEIQNQKPSSFFYSNNNLLEPLKSFLCANGWKLTHTHNNQAEFYVLKNVEVLIWKDMTLPPGLQIQISNHMIRTQHIRNLEHLERITALLTKLSQ